MLIIIKKYQLTNGGAKVNLILKDKEVINNVSANESMIEVSYIDLYDMNNIFSKITNENLENAKLKTNNNLVAIVYNSKVISTTVNNPIKKTLRFNLIDKPTANSELLQETVKNQAATIQEQQENREDLESLIVELTQMLISL